uniref:tRNA (uracil-O(2)-)-methyltransferase n=1 Tax=Clastoptera arizonana TaxID=38151 RepID=A0A1B6DAG1_9HEMI
MDCLKIVAEQTIVANSNQFWKSVEILNKRPHILNRHLIGAEILHEIKISDGEQVIEILNQLKLISSFDLKKVTSDYIKNHITNDFCNKDVPNSAHLVIFVKKLFPRSITNIPRLEITSYDYKSNRITSYNILSKGLESFKPISPEFTYSITFNDNKLELLIEKEVPINHPSCKWLILNLFPKFTKWIEKSDLDATIVPSLNLIPIEKYFNLYQKLKNDYGKKIVEEWPETTDPLKFVYEDIAIAAYLLLLWDNKPQKFVDLGCGNGLLVHILNSEGHIGIGYDLKARKIWKIYPTTTKLEVKCITPSEDTVFPSADWLLGNHSDELTLWIPVFASRSSYQCKFFVLPCCPYDFDGKKYQRTNVSLSQYNDYLDYVEMICNKCGFKTTKDKLRIPSTRRTCFIGTDRKYDESKILDHNIELKEFISSKFRNIQLSDISTTVNSWCFNFKPREEDTVRNCTKLDKSLIDEIVNLIVKQLLIKKRVCDDNNWNAGGILDISLIASLIPKENLKKLKNECGGLQTLIKNNRHIFKVECGKVQFRKPIKQQKRDKNWKIKPCWFFKNHPNSCPIEDEECSFKH